MGTHVATIPQDDLVVVIKLYLVSNFFVVLAIPASKTSFAMTLLGLAIEKWHYWLIWSIIVTVNLTMGVDSLLPWFICVPITKVWDPSVDGYCPDPHISINYSIFATGMRDFYYNPSIEN
jgi:hypothetical protein